ERPARGKTGRPDPHRALEPLFAAARLTRAKVDVLRVPMRSRAKRILPRRLDRALYTLSLLPSHLRLASQLWRRRDHDLLLVREFTTLMLLVVWPLIWALRERTCFLINHNLQEAHQRRFERAALRILYRHGLRIACLETPAGLAELGLPPDETRILVLPHPLGALAPPRPDSPAALPVIGVIGSVRPEKSSEDVLAMLLRLREQGRLKARLVLGCPESEVRERWWNRGFEVFDTRSRAAYLDALDLCDVVVLNYRRDRYLYRASGVVADAVARRAAVVCPDFPLIRHQLSVPARVGCPFQKIGNLEQAITEALALRPTLSEAAQQHESARNPRALAALLDAFVERSSACGGDATRADAPRVSRRRAALTGGRESSMP
ncbi:MAG: hypothetical protein ACREH6_14665, partial [Geminicoccaceae bacterium]